MPSCVSPLSLMAPVSLLPLYFLHGASLSLTSSLSHLFLTARLALALSRIAADFLYLLHDLSPAIYYGYHRAHVATFFLRPTLFPTTLLSSQSHLFRKIPRESDDISGVDVTAARGR